MYKVFIADDEKWIVESLKACINWKEYGFEVIGQARNGEQALKQIMVMKPDVVFTDIRMPGINGLELIKKVKEEIGANIQFIIVSGFAEFAYAQKAINSGAIGYCLKPFDNNDIISLLSKAKQNIETAKRSNETSLFYLLEGTDKKKQTKIIDLFEGAGLQLSENEELLVMESIGSKDLELPPEVQFLKFKTSMKKTAYIFKPAYTELIKAYFHQQKPEGILSIGIGSTIKKISDINTAIEDADISVYHFFITQLMGVYEFSLLKQGDISGTLREVNLAIQQKDTAAINKIFNRLEAEFSNGAYNIKHAFRIYNSTMTYLDSLSNGSSEEYFYNLGQLVDSFDMVKNMLRFLKEQVIKQLAGECDCKIESIENKTFKYILQYINENFYENITLHHLSQKYFVSCSYLCQLFKKEVGVTFTEYISTLRINYACEQLKHSDLHIYVIGEKSGYGDYFYFSKIFKKITGKSPTQYREECTTALNTGML